MSELALIPPYEGKEDYIFISYSHRDMQTVLPILYRLRDAGFRFWYDEGIDPGTEWPESIALHLLDCRVFIAFVSPAAMDSHHCRREIHYALSKSKDFLSVTLEPTEMTPGMEMQLASYQSLNKHKYDDEESFFQRLLSLDVLAPCRQPGPGPEPAPMQEPVPVQEQEPEPEQAQSEGGNGRGGHVLRNVAAVAGAAALLAALLKNGGEQQDKPPEQAPDEPGQSPDAPDGDGQ